MLSVREWLLYQTMLSVREWLLCQRMVSRAIHSPDSLHNLKRMQRRFDFVLWIVCVCRQPLTLQQSSCPGRPAGLCTSSPLLYSGNAKGTGPAGHTGQPT